MKQALIALTLLATVADATAGVYECVPQRGSTILKLTLYDHEEANPRVVFNGESIPAKAFREGFTIVWVWDEAEHFSGDGITFSGGRLEANGDFEAGSYWEINEAGSINIGRPSKFECRRK